MSLDAILLLKDLSNYKFDFKNLFDVKDSIIWKDCSDLTIKIDNKINKLILNNCSNIHVICNHSIAGIEYFKCNNIIQTIHTNHKISSIDIYATELTILIKKNNILPKIIKEDSKLIIELIK